MKQHEREFFISSIRSGKVKVKKDSIQLIIEPLTIDQSVDSCEIYNDAYTQGYVDGMMNEEEMDEWMRDNNLWTIEDDNKIEGLKKDIEKLKIEIYNSRNNTPLKENIRFYIRAGEKQLGQILHKKHQYHQNTIEGFATTEKISWIIKNSTYLNSKLYDFSDIPLTYVVEEWQASFLGDSQIRELARNEPWKSLWTVKQNNGIQLFTNSQNCELTYNQKNLLIWSQMYDNIQESLDCPPKDVIEDDDMLDGWFIIQGQKREQEKFKQELESSTNEKIKNSQEVLIMTKTDKDRQRIHSMNDAHAKGIKKQRQAFLQKAGQVQDHELPDQRLKIQMQQNSQMIGKIKGGR